MEKGKSRIRRKNELKFKKKLHAKNSIANVGKLWNPDNLLKCSGARSRKNLARKNKGDDKKRKTASKRLLT